MSSNSDSAGIKPSIKKLRELREQLCSSQEEWVGAFEVRDFVICELNSLHEMLSDKKVPRAKCLKKSKEILDNFISDVTEGGI